MYDMDEFDSLFANEWEDSNILLYVNNNTLIWGIDTIELSTSCFDYDKKKKRKLKGVYTEDNRTYYNEEGYHITIFDNRIKNSYLQDSTLNIVLNPSKFPNGINLKKTNSIRLGEIFIHLKSLLYDLGCEVNFYTFKINRIDFFKDVITRFPSSDFHFVFNRLNVPSNMEMESYETSIYLENKIERIVLYDKSKELIEKKNFEVKNLKGRYLNRFELRFKEKNKIQREFKKMGGLKYSDLLDDHAMTKIQNIINKKVESLFVDKACAGLNVDEDDYILMNKLSNDGLKRNDILLLLRARDESEMGVLDTFIRTICNNNTQKISNLKKKIHHMLDRYEYVFSSNYIEKYNELYFSLTGKQTNESAN